MLSSDWESLRYFTVSENWGDPDLMEVELVTELDAFRHKAGTPIMVTSGTRGKHAPNSQHYIGKAVDIIFPEIPLHKLPDMFLMAMRFNFRGLGIYPFWELSGNITGGLHLDIRDANERAMWIGLKENEYIPVSFYDLRKYFIGINS